MLSSRRRELMVGLLLFFGLIVVTALAEYHQAVLLRNDAHLAFHAHEFVEALDDLLLTVREAETGHTYYMMTGEDKFLKSYSEAIKATKEKIEAIKQLAQESHEERARVPGLQTLLNGELNELATGLAFRNENGFDAAQMTLLAEREARTMDAFQAGIHEMERYEQVQLKTGEEAIASDHRWAVLTIVVAALLALAIAGAFVWLRFRGEPRATSV